jgi:hypothetical protein
MRRLLTIAGSCAALAAIVALAAFAGGSGVGAGASQPPVLGGTRIAYARFPLASVTGRPDGYRFELRDLRFPPDDPSPSNIICRVDFDSGLRIKRQEFRYAGSPNP